ncbi:RNA polymerase sigma factor [bacterium BFN5]|nr:RNA polymerase sigma factor [bacterium BFN5]
MEKVDSIRSTETFANLDEFIANHQRYIYNLSFRLCGNTEDADDLTQETFLKALQHYDKFRGEANVRTWLSRITINRFLDSKRQEHPHESINLGIVPCTDGDPERIIIRKELQWCIVHVLLHHVPEEYKVVLVLREIYQYSYREIAELLQISVGAVKSRLHRGRLYFHNHLIKSGCVKYVKDYTCYCEVAEKI